MHSIMTTFICFTVWQSNTRRRTSFCRTALYSSTRSKSGRLTMMLPLFNLRHPRKFKTTTSRRGALCVCMKCAFLHIGQLFLLRPWAVSRSLGCGSRRGPACTPRRKCVSRLGYVARALGAQSRTIWQVVAGSLPADLEPTRPIETPRTFFFPHFVTSPGLFLKYHSSRQRLGSHG